LSVSRRPGSFAEAANAGDAYRVNIHSESTPVLRELREMVY